MSLTIAEIVSAEPTKKHILSQLTRVNEGFVQKPLKLSTHECGIHSLMVEEHLIYTMNRILNAIIS